MEVGHCFAASGPGALFNINGTINSTKKNQYILAENLVESARKLRHGCRYLAGAPISNHCVHSLPQKLWG